MIQIICQTVDEMRDVDTLLGGMNDNGVFKHGVHCILMDGTKLGAENAGGSHIVFYRVWENIWDEYDDEIKWVSVGDYESLADAEAVVSRCTVECGHGFRISTETLHIVSHADFDINMINSNRV